MFKKAFSLCLAGAIMSSAIAFPAAAATYTVQSGDYLWKIAVSQKTTVDQLIKLNGLKSTEIYPGQVLQLPADPNTYTVRANDTMWKIAVRFGVSLESLIRANPQITNPNNIWPGLAIHIPQQPTTHLDGVFPLKKGTYQPFTNNYADTRAWSPNGTQLRSHEGVDIFAKKGTPVYAAASGTIINSGWNEYGGWRLTVKVDNNTAFYYAHMSGYAKGMNKGASVKKGQLIGYVGNTGYGPVGTEGDFEPHLHFGMYTISPWQSVDPFTHLALWELNAK